MLADDVPDIEAVAALIDGARPVRVGRNGYTELDRYRDFSRVLRGTDEGKRVMAQIVALCEGPLTHEHELPNHALLAARAWGRAVAMTITSYCLPPLEKEEPTHHGRRSPRNPRNS